jgi:hypothetical protein
VISNTPIKVVYYVVPFTNFQAYKFPHLKHVQHSWENKFNIWKHTHTHTTHLYGSIYSVLTMKTTLTTATWNSPQNKRT